MDPRLTSLLELQKALTTQRELEQQFDELPKRQNEIQTFLDNLKSEANAAEERFKKYEMEQRAIEMDIQDGQTSRVKKEAQLLTLKSNKEYQATLSEIETLDRRNTRSDERMIELMDLLEKEKKALADKRKELEDREEGLKAEYQVLEERKQGLTAKVEDARAVTSKIQTRVRPELYQRFLRVFNNKQGIAVATANGGHCGACSIRLTPRLVQLAKRGQDIVVCEGCQRFLYWDVSLDENQLGTL